MVDFDTIVIKQQLANAPMNVEVARRKEFIDSIEGKPRAQKSVDTVRSIDEQAPVDFSIQEEDFDSITPAPKTKKQNIEPDPIIPER